MEAQRPLPAKANAAQDKRPRFYYGWVIVGVCMAVNALAGNVGVFFGLTIVPLQADLGWSRTTIVFASTLAALTGVVIQPLVGPFIDRYGPKGVLIAGALVGGGALMLAGQSRAPWQYYLSFGVFGLAVLQNVGLQATGVVVPKWFVAKRGRALAFIGTGLSLGSVLGVPVLQALISGLGWRLSSMILGLSLAVGIAAPSALFLHRQPEDLGLLPDGARPENASEPLRRVGAVGLTPRSEPSWTLRTALRTRTLYLLVAAWTLGTLPVTAYFVHTIPYLTDDKAFTAGTAASAWTTWFAFGLASKLAWGFLSERIPVRLSAVACLLGEAVGMVLLLNVGRGEPFLFLWSAVGGAAHGPFVQLQTLMWANYYGRPFLGTIRGVLAPPTVLASAFGPLLAAYLFQQQGEYRTVWLLFIFLFLAGAILALLAAPPKAPERLSPVATR